MMKMRAMIHGMVLFVLLAAAPPGWAVPPTKDGTTSVVVETTRPFEVVLETTRPDVEQSGEADWWVLGRYFEWLQQRWWEIFQQ